MNNTVELSIRKGITENNPQRLIISDQFIQYDNFKKTPTKFLKTDIKDCRFGIRWIEVEFTIGREYQVFIRNKKDELLKIQFKSYFGYKKTQLLNDYNTILENLWNFYFDDIAQSFIDQFWENKPFFIDKTQISKEGITIKLDKVLKQKEVLIKWEDAGTTDYVTYFVIYSKSDQRNINRAFYYLEDWNTHILYSVVRTILRDIN